MRVTIDAFHADHGSVVVFECEDQDDGERYLVAIDHGPAQAIADALANSDCWPEAEIESWQLVGCLTRARPYEDKLEAEREAAHEAEMDEKQYRHDRWADETFG